MTCSVTVQFLCSFKYVHGKDVLGFLKHDQKDETSRGGGREWKEEIALSQSGALLLYPVANTTAWNAISPPSTNLAPLLVSDSTSDTICHCQREEQRCAIRNHRCGYRNTLQRAHRTHSESCLSLLCQKPNEMMTHSDPRSKRASSNDEPHETMCGEIDGEHS